MSHTLLMIINKEVPGSIVLMIINKVCDTVSLEAEQVAEQHDVGVAPRAFAEEVHFEAR